MYKYKEAFERLPERFRKPNNEDLYYVLYGLGYDDMYIALDSVKDSRDISKANGKSLDYLGANVGEFRQGQDDERYRLLVLTRILMNLSMGDIPTINKIMSILFKDSYIGLTEGFLDSKFLYKEPASFKLLIEDKGQDLPFDVLDRIRAAAIRVAVEILSRLQLKLVSRHGMGSYKIWLCGEHPCGDIPYIRNVGVREDVDLKIKAGLNAAKQYYPRTGDNLKSAEAYDFSPAEIWYSQDVASTRVIKFREDDK